MNCFYTVALLSISMYLITLTTQSQQNDCTQLHYIQAADIKVLLCGHFIDLLFYIFQTSICTLRKYYDPCLCHIVILAKLCNYGLVRPKHVVGELIHFVCVLL
jgi:hypothetical protein